MATATQLAGGPLLNGNIPPGMSYKASTNTWSFSGAVSMGTPLVIGTDPGGTEILRVGGAVRSGGNYTVAKSDPRVNLTGTKAGGNDWFFQAVDADGRFRIFDSTAGNEPLAIAQGAAGAITLGGATKRSVSTTGGRIVALVVATATLTLDATHHSVVCNKATAMTVNLPAVASNAGRTYVIKNKGAGVVTIDANASEQIDNATTLALNQWQTATIVCDGAIWCVI